MYFECQQKSTMSETRKYLDKSIRQTGKENLRKPKIQTNPFITYKNLKKPYIQKAILTPYKEQGYRLTKAHPCQKSARQRGFWRLSGHE